MNNNNINEQDKVKYARRERFKRKSYLMLLG